MVTDERLNFQTYFVTQKRCLTGLHFLNNLIVSAIAKKNGFRIVEEGKKKLYQVKMALVRSLCLPLQAESAIFTTAKHAEKDASHDPKKYREVRAILENEGWFRHFSGKNPDGDSPPCRYAGIKLKELLRAFQDLYARFFELQAIAIEKGNRVLAMPMHHFTTIRSLFNAVWGFACSVSTIEPNLYELSEESRIEEGKEREQLWIDSVIRRIESLKAELSNAFNFGIDTHRIEQELNYWRSRLVCTIEIEEN